MSLPDPELQTGEVNTWVLWSSRRMECYCEEKAQGSVSVGMLPHRRGLETILQEDHEARNGSVIQVT